MIARPALARRTVLIGAAVSGSALLTGCHGGRTPPVATPTPSATPSPSAAPSAPDLQAASLALALEDLLVAVYDAGIAAATDGRLGVVPAAIVGFVTATRAHHVDHARAWTALLEQSHGDALEGGRLASAEAVLGRVAKAKTFAAFGAIAIEAERVAAATYLASVTSASLQSVVATGVSIAPVEAEHAAALALLTGQAPLAHPSAGALFDLHGALTVADLTVPRG